MTCPLPQEYVAVEGPRTTARGTVKIAISMGVAAVCGVVLHVFLARALQPDLYGMLAVVTSVVVWWELVGVAAVRQATERAVAAAGDAWQGVAGTAIRVTAVWGLALMLLCQLSAPGIAAALGDMALVPYVRLMALGIPLWVLWGVLTAVLNGRRLYGLRAAGVVAYWVAKVLLMCGLVALGFFLHGAVLGSVSGAAIALIVAWLLVGVRLPRGGLPVTQLVSFGLPLVGLAVVERLVVSIDLWSVKAMLPAADAAGHYGVAKYAFQAAVMLPLAVCGAVFPTLTMAIGAADRASARELIGEAARFVLVLLMPMIAIFACCGRELIVLVFGVAYAASALPVVLLLGAALLAGLRYVAETSLIAAGRPGRALAAFSPALPVTVVLNLFLVARQGMAGAAVASGAGLLLSFALTWWLVWREFRVLPPAAVAMRTLLAAGGAYAVGLLVPAQDWLVVIKAAGAGGLYLLLLALLGELRMRDLAPLAFWRKPGRVAPVIAGTEIDRT